MTSFHQWTVHRTVLDKWRLRQSNPDPSLLFFNDQWAALQESRGCTQTMPVLLVLVNESCSFAFVVR